MGKFSVDTQDLAFTLFDVLNVQQQKTDLSEQDLKGILEEFVKFADKKVYPTRATSDHEGVKLSQGKVTIPGSFHEVLKEYYGNGWYGLGVEEEWGGNPVPEAIKVACRAIADGANVAMFLYPGLSFAAMNVIKTIGTDDQKKSFITKMMTGEWGGTMCLTESGAGSDVGNLRTTATALGNGKYKLQGEKIFISSGENDFYSNIIHLVLARTDQKITGTKGLSLFIVPKFRLNADGTIGAHNNVVCTKVEEKMGIHASATCVLSFGAQGDSEGVLIGKEFEGMANMFIMMNEARLLCGIQGDGQSNLSTELSIAYAKDRQQFGKEIVQHPDVVRMLLRMRTLSRGMRALNLYVANLFDTYHHSQDEAQKHAIELLTPVCKVFCSEKGIEVCSLGIQIHGGYGYCQEYGVEQFLRDVRISAIYEGTTGIQSLDFVMRKIIKDGGKTFQEMNNRIAAECSDGVPKELSSEAAFLKENTELAQKIVAEVLQKMRALDMNWIAGKSCQILEMYGNVVVGWRLLVAAKQATKKAEKETVEAKKAYYESKRVDFKFFVQHILSSNLGNYKSIKEFSDTGIVF